MKRGQKKRREEKALRSAISAGKKRGREIGPIKKNDPES